MVPSKASILMLSQEPEHFPHNILLRNVCVYMLAMQLKQYVRHKFQSVRRRRRRTERDIFFFAVLLKTPLRRPSFQLETTSDFPPKTCCWVTLDFFQCWCSFTLKEVHCYTLLLNYILPTYLFIYATKSPFFPELIPSPPRCTSAGGSIQRSSGRAQTLI